MSETKSPVSYTHLRIQQEYLSSRGFSVRADLAGEETAFIAEYGSGKPVIAFLGEFDALSSLQQEPDKTERCPIAGKENGHGCGHHLLGTASAAAADVLKTYMAVSYTHLDVYKRQAQRQLCSKSESSSGGI